MKPRADTLTSYLYIIVVWTLESTFCNRIVTVWNSLQAAADDFATVRDLLSERTSLNTWFINVIFRFPVS